MSQVKNNREGKFMLLAHTIGAKAPKYVHRTVNDAAIEAKRLCGVLKCKVEILEIIGEVEEREVPVTELKPYIIIYKDDLPF